VVHILHQDDLVLPGFYTELEDAFLKNSSLGAAYCRHQTIDENGSTISESKLEQNESGIFHGFLERIAVAQLIQTPSIAVRRSVYEQLGGFTTDLSYALDWDMWTRIAVTFDIWYGVNILAAYRIHPQSETSHLENSAETIRDIQRFFELRKQYLPDDVFKNSEILARQNYAKFAFKRAIGSFNRHHYKNGWLLIIEGLKLRADCKTINTLYRALRNYFLKHVSAKIKNMNSISSNKGSK